MTLTILVVVWVGDLLKPLMKGCRGKRWDSQSKDLDNGEGPLAGSSRNHILMEPEINLELTFE